MAHVSPEKKEVVATLVRRLESAPVVAVVKIQGIPAPQFQAMRAQLRGTAELTVSKNNLLRIALREAAATRSGLDALAAVIDGQTAVVTAAMNPFRLFKHLEATKAPAAARGGEAAPEDIWVREGETPFKPGPVVGDLQKAGIPAAIERGKVIIKKDKLLVKAGDRIPRDVAQVLARLDIRPLIVGLDTRGAFEGGTVFRRDVLAIDDAAVRGDVARAGVHAFALAMAAAFPTRLTVRPMLARAHLRALNLAVGAAIPTSESIRLLLAQAYAQMLALAARAPGGADEDLRSQFGKGAPLPESKQPKAEEPKKEEKAPSEDEVAAGLGALFG